MARARKGAAVDLAVSEKIRRTIHDRGLAANAVAVEAGVSPTIVQRFLARKRGMSGETTDRVARALGLQLVEGRGGLR